MSSIAAGLLYFFLDKKVTKNQVNRHLLLCRTLPLPRKTTKTKGCNTLPHYRSLLPKLQQSLLMPFPPHMPPLFCLISPETGLLTGVHLVLLTLLNKSK